MSPVPSTVASWGADRGPIQTVAGFLNLREPGAFRPRNRSLPELESEPSTRVVCLRQKGEPQCLHSASEREA
jgi:hypothetical protein